MTLAEKLLQLRKREGLSQEELAAQLHVSRQAVSRWELGTAMPDAPNLLQLSKLFGVTTDWLLHDEWENEPAGPGTQTAEKKGKREQDRQAVLAGLVGLHAVALFWEMLGWNIYEPGWPFWLGVTLALLDIIGFEVWLRRSASEETAQALRKKYYRRSVWLFAYFPLRMLCLAVGQVYPKPYPTLLRKAVSVLAYLLVCAAVTWLLREKKDAE